jgi:putative oxidoreductase
VTLFTDEFMLHLPGGPYHYPVPAVMAFLSGCGEIPFPVLLALLPRALPRSACCS